MRILRWPSFGTEHFYVYINILLDVYINSNFDFVIDRVRRAGICSKLLRLHFEFLVFSNFFQTSDHPVNFAKKTSQISDRTLLMIVGSNQLINDSSYAVNSSISMNFQ